MKKMRIMSLLLVALLSVAAIGDSLDVINSTEGSWHDINPNYLWGQTFTPGADYLTAVELYGLPGSHAWNSGQTPGTTMTVKIYEALGFSGTDLTLGNLLGSATRTSPLGPDGTNWTGRYELGYIDVSSYVGNAADNALAMVFETGAGWTGSETVMFNFGVYAGGTGLRSTDGGATWDNDGVGPTGDMLFRTYGDVPEPATICLLGIGSLALLKKRS